MRGHVLTLWLCATPRVLAGGDGVGGPQVLPRWPGGEKQGKHPCQELYRMLVHVLVGLLVCLRVQPRNRLADAQDCVLSCSL
jgi:hypothetical protein